MPVVPGSGHYSAVEDFVLGDMPLPSEDMGLKYIQDAADEIDSMIGHIYVTPVDMSDDPGTTTRPSRLILKRVSNWLASGRFIMAQAAGSQQRELHAYGERLVDEAHTALKAIQTGLIILDGAAVPAGPSEVFTGPIISNVDPESNVEAFYDRISNPNYTFGYGTPGGLVGN